MIHTVGGANSRNFQMTLWTVKELLLFSLHHEYCQHGGGNSAGTNWFFSEEPPKCIAIKWAGKQTVWSSRQTTLTTPLTWKGLLSTNKSDKWCIPAASPALQYCIHGIKEFFLRYTVAAGSHQLAHALPLSHKQLLFPRTIRLSFQRESLFLSVESPTDYGLRTVFRWEKAKLPPWPRTWADLCCSQEVWAYTSSLTTCLTLR